MATAQEQARYRARDGKRLVQIRLDPATVERLDALVQAKGATGRAEIIEALLTGDSRAIDTDDPKAWGREGTRLLRRFFRATGRTEGCARNERGEVDMWIQCRF